jgi:ATP-dependent Clp protease protease subunit
MKVRNWLLFVLTFVLIIWAMSALAYQFPFFKPAPIVANSTTVPDKITLYDEINDETAAVVIQQIQVANKAESVKPIYLFINSPGGDVGAGGSILDAMKASKRPITTVCVATCASMAAVVFEYGAHRQAMGHSVLMFHEASARLEGSLSHMLSRLTLYIRITAEYEIKIAALASMPVEEFRVRELREWWLPSDEALAAHLCDSVTEFADYPATK